MPSQHVNRIGSHESTPHVRYSYPNPLSRKGMADKRHYIADASHAVTSVSNCPDINLEFIANCHQWTFERSAYATRM